MSERSREAWSWWNRRRLFYNTALVFVGFVAFVVYLVVGFHCIVRLPPGHEGELEITAFTILVQGIGYLFAMAVANVAYCLGPLSELLLRPNPIDVYRRGMFWLGFGFSVVLPFLYPLLVGLACAPLLNGFTLAGNALRG
jgi:hypothetical protein